MKKITVILLALLMVAAMAGCGQGGRTIEDIKKAGKLVLATSADYPPFEGIDDDGTTIIGFDIDIARAIAEKMGVPLEIKNMDFDGLLEAINQGKADVVLAGMGADAEREKSVDFSKVYFYDEFLLVVADDNDTIKTAADMNGKKIGVQLGTTCEAAAEAIEGVETKPMDKVDLILLEVQSGRVDGAVINLTVAMEYLKTMDGLKTVEIPELNENPEGYAVAVKEGSRELVNFINEVIDDLMDSGEYDDLLEKWDLTSK